MRLRVVIGGGICVLLPDWTTLGLVSRASSRWRERMSGKENNMSDRNEIVSRVTAALEGKPAPVAIRNARKVDACGERRGYWVVSDAAGVIVAAGTGGRPSSTTVARWGSTRPIATRSSTPKAVF